MREMNRDEVIRSIREHLPDLERFDVRSIAVFGSIARDEATADSDVDVLVAFEGAMTFDAYMGLKHYLEHLLGRTVDLATIDALKPARRERVLREAVAIRGEIPSLTPDELRRDASQNGRGERLRDFVIATLHAHREDLEKLGARSISLFGSVARGQASVLSDVDLLVDLDDTVTLFGLSRLKRRLEELLGRTVDVVPRESLRKEFRDQVFAEEIRAA
jgi:predicted nucleotidyltransferase